MNLKVEQDKEIVLEDSFLAKSSLEGKQEAKSGGKVVTWLGKGARGPIRRVGKRLVTRRQGRRQCRRQIPSDDLAGCW